MTEKKKATRVDDRIVISESGVKEAKSAIHAMERARIDKARARAGGMSDPSKLLHLESDSEAAFLAICLTIYRDDRDGLSPGADLIGSLVHCYSFEPLTSEEVDRRVAEFRGNFECARRDARRFIDQYGLGVLEQNDDEGDDGGKANE